MKFDLPFFSLKNSQYFDHFHLGSVFCFPDCSPFIEGFNDTIMIFSDNMTDVTTAERNCGKLNGRLVAIKDHLINTSVFTGLAEYITGRARLKH